MVLFTSAAINDILLSMVKDQDKPDINAPDCEDGWYRPKQVKLDGDTVRWELDPARRYRFVEAYGKNPDCKLNPDPSLNPHRQLMEAVDDGKLLDFLQQWGPLQRASLNSWSGSNSIESCREERDKLSALVRLMASASQPGMERRALFGCLNCQSFMDSAHALPLKAALSRFASEEDFRRSIDTVSEAEIQELMDWVLRRIPYPAIAPHGVTVRAVSAPRLSVSFGLHNLVTALEWMVWKDVERNHAFRFCIECGNFINEDTGRKRKFCTGGMCANRRTVREWMRADRDRKRRELQKVQDRKRRDRERKRRARENAKAKGKV
jgi:hypothetical protein